MGEKLLSMLAPARLVSEASAGVGFDAPLKEVTVKAGILFVRFPLTVIDTSSVSVHSVSGAR